MDSKDPRKLWVHVTQLLASSSCRPVSRSIRFLKRRLAVECDSRQKRGLAAVMSGVGFNKSVELVNEHLSER